MQATELPDAPLVWRGKVPASAWLLELSSAPIVLPKDCAACGAPADQSLRIGSAERQLLVPYCQGCKAELSSQETLSAVGKLSALLLGLVLLLVLPSAFLTLDRLGFVACVVGGAALPQLVVGLALKRRTQSGFQGRAVWWTQRGLVCTSQRWVESLARESGKLPRAVSKRRYGGLGAWGTLGLLFALAMSTYPYQYPLLLWVNVGEDPLRLFLDGVELDVLTPMTREEPARLGRLRVAVGSHELSVLPAPEVGVGELEDIPALDGPPPGGTRVRLRPGRQHFFAPSHPGICFRIETTHYGTDGGEHKRSAVSELSPEETFWSFTQDIDRWLTPLPEPGDDTRSTGGSLRALRFGPCAARS